MTTHRFPMTSVLRDGRRVIVRPFRETDVSVLHDFFLRIPVDWRRFAWDPIERRGLVESWADNIDYDKVFPLLAFDGSRVVADASLHRREFGPLRLVGRIKWLIDPAFRGVGLGAMLVNLLMDAARDRGLRHLTAMLISDLEQDAIEVLTPLGFKEYRIPGYGTDPDGNNHDMSKLVFSFPENGAPV
ncbi:MAG TPA: GNAT family N-acetyltransferase [Vicinamibacteria bacterium]|nr:GNAT family N-acetyltransferase [Vicinamibacteria bacterium]